MGILNIGLNPSECDILGVIKTYFYIRVIAYDDNEKEIMVVLKITEADFYKQFKKWAKAKRGYCERNNHFCGVFGDIAVEEYKIVGNIDILDEISDDEEITYILVPLIEVIKWSDFADMEHG